MIRRISDRNDIDCKALSETYLGKKMLSYLEAYGTDYDFCRFYVNESGSVLLIINSTLLISGSNFEKEELCGFAAMHQPFRIEGNQNALNMPFYFVFQDNMPAILKIYGHIRFLWLKVW